MKTDRFMISMAEACFLLLLFVVASLLPAEAQNSSNTVPGVVNSYLAASGGGRTTATMPATSPSIGSKTSDEGPSMIPR